MARSSWRTTNPQGNYREIAAATWEKKTEFQEILFQELK